MDDTTGQRPPESPEDRRDELFKAGADAAQHLAATADYSADVHERMAEHDPAAAEHAARDRRFAAAEREAARALRAHQVPAGTVRDTIRTSGTASPQPDPEDPADR